MADGPMRLAGGSGSFICFSCAQDNLIGLPVPVTQTISCSMKILVVEDDPSIADVLRRVLQKERYAVDIAYAGDDGESLARRNAYDLILLDLMLPRKEGGAVCSALRAADVRTPIIIMTAHDTMTRREEWSRVGADDYIIKPFNFTDLLARVGALVGAVDAAIPAPLDLAGLRIDGVRRSVTRNGRPISLTANEYALLEYMVANRDIVLTPTMISEYVWKMSFDPMSNIVDSAVRFLKKKIDGASAVPLIHIADAGYRFSDRP